MELFSVEQYEALSLEEQVFLRNWRVGVARGDSFIPFLFPIGFLGHKRYPAGNYLGQKHIVQIVHGSAGDDGQNVYLDGITVCDFAALWGRVERNGICIHDPLVDIPKILAKYRESRGETNETGPNGESLHAEWNVTPVTVEVPAYQVGINDEPQSFGDWLYADQLKKAREIKAVEFKSDVAPGESAEFVAEKAEAHLRRFRSLNALISAHDEFVARFLEYQRNRTEAPKLDLAEISRFIKREQMCVNKAASEFTPK